MPSQEITGPVPPSTPSVCSIWWMAAPPSQVLRPNHPAATSPACSREGVGAGPKGTGRPWRVPSRRAALSALGNEQAPLAAAHAHGQAILLPAAPPRSTAGSTAPRTPKLLRASTGKGTPYLTPACPIRTMGSSTSALASRMHAMPWLQLMPARGGRRRRRAAGVGCTAARPQRSGWLCGLPHGRLDRPAARRQRLTQLHQASRQEPAADRHHEADPQRCRGAGPRKVAAGRARRNCSTRR